MLSQVSSFNFDVFAVYLRSMSEEAIRPPCIVDYDDYRAYLKDWYRHAKASDSKVSFRFLSQRTGLSSPNYWKLIMEDERKLSSDMIPRFARTLKLEESEAQYFHHLVMMNQSPGLRERALHAQNLADLKKRLAPIAVHTPDSTYFSRWCLPLIREAAVLAGPKNSPQEIHGILRISISESEVEEALGILLEGGFLTRTCGGLYRETNKLLSTGDRVSSVLAMRYMSRMIEESLPALENVEAHEREYGALTLSLGSANYNKLKELVREFRKEALRLAAEDHQAGSHVVQVNLQIFPLTKGAHS